MLTEKVVREVRSVTKKPLIVKLSPNVTDITLIARAAVDGGADALSLINTLTGMAVNVKTRRPHLGNIRGGLSGPAIKPVALHQLWKTKNAVSVPLIGIGGIMTWSDAVEFMLVGASAVQIGTAHFRDPDTCAKVAKGIESYCKREKITDVREIVGKLGC